LKGLCLALVSFPRMAFLTYLEEGIGSSWLRLMCDEWEECTVGLRGLIFPMRG